MISFGSCNRQDKPQNYWEKIHSLKPDWFLWIGDLVYAKTQTLISLEKGFQLQLNSSYYQHFAQNTEIDGIWDDHDYGINDAGKYVIDRLQRQEKYLNFLINSGAKDLNYLYKQDGLYHSRDVLLATRNVNSNHKNEMKVRIIFLDTRSFRENHFIRSVGEIDFPLSAIIAAAIRASYSIMGFGRDYNADVLGEPQWKWFEGQLKEVAAPNSGVDFVVVVSSIQLLTTNPVVESWGHFPVAKKRFFDLLTAYEPSNVVFLSGDVHMGEISSARYMRKDGTEGQWFEVTSSGLTHTCAQSGLNKYLCPLMTSIFARHRLNSQAFTHEKNFGSISFYNEREKQLANISIFSIERNPVSPVLSVQIPLNHKVSSLIDKVEFEDFPVLEKSHQAVVYGVISFILLAFVYYIRQCRAAKKVKTK